MGFGSWIRFFLGIVLSIEILRNWFIGGSLSSFAIILSVVFLILSAAWFMFGF